MGQRVDLRIDVTNALNVGGTGSCRPLSNADGFLSQWIISADLSRHGGLRPLWSRLLQLWANLFVLDDLNVEPDRQQISKIESVGPRLFQVEVVEIAYLHPRIGCRAGPTSTQDLVHRAAILQVKPEVIVPADEHRFLVLGHIDKVTAGIL